MIGRFITVAILLITFVSFLAVQLRRTLAEGNVLPANPPGPARTARIAEALALALMGLAIIAFGGIDYHNGGNLLRLGEIPPAEALALVGVVLGAVAIGAVAVVIVLMGRTSLGVLVMAGGLCAYGLLINGPLPVRELVGKQKEDPGAWTYELQIHDTNLVGADLWVNDVYLGKTPVRMTFDEFFAKVPDWPEPPEGYEEGAYSVSAPEYKPSHTWTRRYQRLVAFDPIKPKYGGEIDSYRPGPYYARLKYAGEEGLTPGPPGRHPGHLLVEFPQREKRLHRVLDQARLADYEVDAGWFEAVETYGDDGWRALLGAADTEPGLGDVIDAWTTWRYGLDSVKDADSAWEAFERVLVAVDDQGSYATPSLTSRAVELLTPNLDPDRLVAEAERLLSSNRGDCYAVWGSQEAREFGTLDATRRGPGLSRRKGRWRISDYELSASGYAVTHAVWLLDQRLDAEAPDAPNVVEERIVPLLIKESYPFRYSIREGGPFGMAVALGGRTIERFLLKHDWNRTPDRFPSREPFIDIRHGVRVNPWLYSLAYLDGPVAEQFRLEHSDRFLQMARRINAADVWFGPDWDRPRLDFLFNDLDRSEKSLAFRFWPEFRKEARTWDRWGLTELLEYLVRMEPLATPEMYVECIREAGRDPDAWGSWLGPLTELPEDKRSEVFSALIRAAERGDFSDTETSERLVAELRQGANPQEYLTRDILNSLRSGDGKYKPENIANWLEHTEPAHPLVAALAEEEDPKLRMLVMGALRAHPTPENRIVLEGLLSDANEDVRRAAQDVQADLEELAATPHMTFASDPGAVSKESA